MPSLHRSGVRKLPSYASVRQVNQTLDLLFQTISSFHHDRKEDSKSLDVEEFMAQKLIEIQ